MAYSNSTHLGEEKIYYFTGKVRAFWKDKIFFLDQRNAAIVGYEKLYIDGKKATQTDLHNLDVMVASSGWEMAPAIHSYVVKYKSSEATPWPYKLQGKVLWFARFAWIGPMPKAVEQQLEKCNVVYMPLTYYTGHFMSVFGDNFVFGDSRNNVLAHISDVSFYGHYVDRDTLLDLEHHAPLIHSFIASPEFLTSKHYEGPEPHLPTWQIDNYGSSVWVAKFAWVGEMPYEYRQQLSRFQIIKLGEWNTLCSTWGNIQSRLSIPGNHSQASLFSVPQQAKGIGNGTKTFAEPLLVTTQKEAAIVKGSLLMANHEYGLINSYLDVIVFSVKNFYVNGEIFKGGKGLDKFFHEKNVQLTTWIVPLQEPILVFDIYVMWRAVCVWHGIPPKNMEAIKNRYDKGNISGSVPQALNTASDKRYSLVLGKVVQISYCYGYAKAVVGNTTIDISFKRKAVYMKGYKLHTKCSLLEVKKELEAGTWVLLVYPVNEASGLMYAAIALWEYQYQHLVSADLLFRILLEGRNVTPEDFPGLEGAESSGKPDDDKTGIHMTGMIVKATPEYGILETKSITIEPSYVFFLRKDLYIDGSVPDAHQMIRQLDKSRQVNLYGRSTKCQVIKDYPVTMYATLVWMGKKPSEIRKPSSKSPVDLPVKEDSTLGHSEDNSNNTKDSKSPGEVSCEDGNFKAALELVKTDSPVMEHRYGRFVHLQDRYGVIRCGGGGKGCTYVLFDFSVLWIDGDRLELSDSLDDSIIEDKVQCNLLAYEIPPVKVLAFQVSMQATAVWMGKRPLHLVLPEVLSPLKAMEVIDEQVKTKPEGTVKRKKDYLKSNKTKDAGNNGKDISSKLSDIKLTDSKGFVPVSLEDVASSLEKPYAGKHVTGRILKVMKGCGIAMWRCAAKEGEVFMFFFKKNVYVNLCPMDESYEVDKAKAFNFYVVPVLHKIIGGYNVSLYATCGWKGSKPHNIPAPGAQSLAQVSLDSVYALEVDVGKTVPAYIVKLMKNRGIARWRSPPHGGDIFIEFDKKLTCDNIKSIFDKGINAEENSRPCLFIVKPIEHKEIEGYIVSLAAMCGWLGKKPSHLPKPKSRHEPTLLGHKLHASPAPLDILETAAAMAVGIPKEPSQSKVKEECLSALDSVEDPEKNVEIKEKKRKSKLEVWEEDKISEISLEGKIVELYSNNGRLEGTNEMRHFFSRENSYLYGVCLNNIELWHVLVQDESVSYRLNEMCAGESKVSKMWIGPEKIAAEEATIKINEWCNKHTVPGGARELLLHQLELSQDNREREEATS